MYTEPVLADTLWSNNNNNNSSNSNNSNNNNNNNNNNNSNNNVQILTFIRMRSGFEPEFIIDAQLPSFLGLDGHYPDADIPDWMMTDLEVLASKNLITVDEFRMALVYVLGRYY